MSREMRRATDRGEAEDIPILVRLAGLPADSMAPFHSAACAERLVVLDRWDDKLASRRAEMVDRLFEAIHGAEAEKRHFLLGVKRDCYNGRPLARHRDDPQWSLVDALAGSLAEEILDLEKARGQALADFESTFFAERDRERGVLPELLEHPGLLRGLALASPVLVANVDRLRRAVPGSFDRKARKQAESLLRYSSRAAFKLSPYSTLTRTALGAATEGVGGAIDFAPHPWSSRSLMRLKRYSLNQHLEILQRYGPFRGDLPLELNNTIEEPETGRYRFLRMGFWQPDKETKRLGFQRDALVAVALGGALASWLLANLRQRDPSPSYRQVVEELATEMGGDDSPSESTRAQVAKALDQLLHVGFLRFRLPWPTNEIHLERRLLDHLDTLEPEPGLDRVRGELAPLVGHELGYAATEEPLASVQALDGHLRQLSRHLAELETHGPGVSCQIIPKGNVFEDVFVTPAGSGSDDGTSGGTTGATAGTTAPPPLLRLRRSTARELLDTTRPLIRLAGLFDGRLELGLTLDGFIRRQWPDRDEVPLLEVFGAFQPLWQKFLEHSGTGRWTENAPFNPLELEKLDTLGSLRAELRQELARRVEHGQGPGASDGEGEESHLAPDELAELVAQIPENFALPIGAALCLQPLDAAGERWMVNQTMRGIGRFGSRFSAVMDEASRRGYCRHLEKRSTLSDGDRPLELLDLMCVQGDTLNVHRAQTRFALELPGLASDLPAERRRSAAELSLALGTEGQPPTLVDTSGRAFLPVHLGVSALVFMPALVRFLSVLGVGESRSLGPRPRRRENDGLVVEDRMVVGPVVLQRRRWTFGRKHLPRKLNHLGEAEAYAAIHRWRRSHRLPDRIFFKELRLADDTRKLFKPQAVDFTSPGFVDILRGTLESRPERLVIEEMLPEPDAYPADTEGRRWAVELVLDALAFAPSREGDDREPRAA